MIMSPNREQIKSKPNDEDLIARINALEPSERKQKHNKITRLMPTIKDALERDVWLSDIAKLLRQQGLEVSLTTLRSKLKDHDVQCDLKYFSQHHWSPWSAVQHLPPPPIPARTEPDKPESPDNDDNLTDASS